MNSRCDARIASYVAAALLMFLRASQCPGQVSGGSIVGLVTDSSGAVIAGATAKATNLGTNQTSQTASNSSGYYEFPLLPAGRYIVRVEHTGFARVECSAFDLNTGTQPRIDFTLKVGEVSSKIEVTASAPLVNDTNTGMGVVIDNSKIEELPLNGRNFQQLVGLQPGASYLPVTAEGARAGMSFNGSPAESNNMMLDGVDMSFGELNAAPGDTAGGSTNGSLIQGVSVDAIQEFKVTTNAFSAEFGRAAGGVMNVTTKSGTNQFHGTLFEFFRNDKLDANSFFSNSSKLVRPPLRWNQYGGNLGGPIKRNRFFFFFNYEGAQVRRPVNLTGNVPSPLLLSEVPPAIQQAFAGLYKTYTPTSNPLIGTTRRNDDNSNEENTTLSRGDAMLGKHRLSLRYSYNHQDFSTANLRPDNYTLYPTRFHNAAIEDADPVSANVFNDFRLGFSRTDLDRSNTDYGQLPGIIVVTSGSLTSDSESRLHFDSASYTIADNLTIVRGPHSIKTGFEIRDLRTARNQVNAFSTTYNNTADLIANNPASMTITFGNPGRGLSDTDYSLFVQDDWKVSRHAQVNAGLRYDYFSPFQGGFNITGSNPFGAFGNNHQNMYAPDRTDFGPRLGLVFDVLGNQKLVARAGGGLIYTPPQAYDLYGLSFISPLIPFNAILTPSDVPKSFPFAFPFDQVAFTNTVVANPSLLPPGLALGRNVYDYNRRTERAYEWNVSVQWALTSSLAVQAADVGNRALYVYSNRPANQFLPKGGPRPQPTFGDTTMRENAANSSYHALQLSANQRLKHGLTVDAYYTFGKRLSYYGVDQTSASTNAAIEDPYNLAGSYGRTADDIRQVFTGVFSYAIPTPAVLRSTRFTRGVFSGWALQGIVTRRSGLPINVLSGTDLAGNQRPHRPEA